MDQGIISLLIACVGLATACLTLAKQWRDYQRQTPEPKPRPLQNDELSYFHNSGVQTSPLNIRWFKWYLIVFGLVSTSISLYTFATHGLHALDMEDFLIPAISLILALILRFEPPSRTLKHAEYELRTSREKAAHQSLEALVKMGARVSTFSVEKGLLKARMGRARDLGQIIIVRVVMACDRTKVMIESDHVVPCAWTDFGANQRNLDCFEKHLLHL